jgi:hypothetical protein
MVVFVPYPNLPSPDLSETEANEQFDQARRDNEVRVRGESWSTATRRKDFVPQLDIIAPDGETVVLTTRKFLLQLAEEGQAEKFQLVQTFGETFIHLFGRQPTIFNYAGTLLDAQSPWNSTQGSRYGSIDAVKGPNASNWVANFDFLYDMFLRGYSAAEKKLMVRLQFKDYLRRGILLNFSKRHVAESVSGVPFSFSMYVISTDYLQYGTGEHMEQLARIYNDYKDGKELVPQSLAVQTSSPVPSNIRGNITTANSIGYAYGGTVFKNDRLDELLFGIVDD